MDRRTSLLSAVAVGAVVLAGGAAVAANVGILGAANNDSIGQLTASGGIGFADPAPAVTNDPTSPDGRQPTSGDDTAPTVADTQLFRVGDVGLVAVARTANGIELVDVTPEPGWSWAPSMAADGQLAVTFFAGNDGVVFTAEVGPDGAVAARVTQVDIPPAASDLTAISATAGADHGYSPQHVEHEEYEGGDDDD